MKKIIFILIASLFLMSCSLSSSDYDISKIKAVLVSGNEPSSSLMSSRVSAPVADPEEISLYFERVGVMAYQESPGFEDRSDAGGGGGGYLGWAYSWILSEMDATNITLRNNELFDISAWAKSPQLYELDSEFANTYDDFSIDILEVFLRQMKIYINETEYSCIYIGNEHFNAMSELSIMFVNDNWINEAGMILLDSNTEGEYFVKDISISLVDNIDIQNKILHIVNKGMGHPFVTLILIPYDMVKLKVNENGVGLENPLAKIKLNFDDLFEDGVVLKLNEEGVPLGLDVEIVEE